MHKSKKIFFQLISLMRTDEILRIENEPFLSLVIENIGMADTPYGKAILYSLCHGYEWPENHFVFERQMHLMVWLSDIEQRGFLDAVDYG